jgi:RNA polymerase sigma factor (sigma-70 family)
MMNKQERIETVYRESGPRLLAWLRSRVGDEAPDILQDVVARALANLDTLEAVRDLGAWVWRAVRNRVIDLWRSREVRGRVDDDGEGDGDLDDLVDDAWREAYDGVEEDELLEALDEAIGRLPPDQREVIVAQGLNGETFASISARTGVPVETLAARKRYALAKLRKALEDFTEEYL